MVEVGLTWVRIGEFAWSRYEAKPGKLTFEWLDRAIETLGSAGLKVVLGTPTATPPRWMIDKHPDMLAHDAEGHPRKFGSRRHYCFSHLGYREESRRITRLMAERYGSNPHVAAWQTDNEFDCHDTVISYSPAALQGFRAWCAERYGTIEALNAAWGNVFWSMEYRDFDDIELPNLTVTEPNPAHVLAFRRYSSDQVVAFNRVQVEEIRKASSAPILHNYMGRITSFDHYAVGADLDIATWDSYPLGFLMDRMEDTADHKAAYARQGDPDFQAFHHDLYRGVGRGRWWVIEQQPGPVNWAPWNPAPLPGMERLWAWEAFAHGAECVSYFRWRQAPFAQEQQHAGMLRPDNEPAAAYHAAEQITQEISDLGSVEAAPADAALIFDYGSAYMWETQPQGQDFDYFRLVFETYRALRAAGLNVDIISPKADLASYPVVLAPGLAQSRDLSSATGKVVIGPRAFCKTEEFSIPVPLPPGLPGVVVTHVESLPPSLTFGVGNQGRISRWLDRVEVSAPAQAIWSLADGGAALTKSGDTYYLAGWLDGAGLEALLAELGLPNAQLPDGLRLRKLAGGRRIVWNYSGHDVTWNGKTYAPAEVAFEGEV